MRCVDVTEERIRAVGGAGPYGDNRNRLYVRKGLLQNLQNCGRGRRLDVPKPNGAQSLHLVVPTFKNAGLVKTVPNVVEFAQKFVVVYDAAQGFESLGR